MASTGEAGRRASSRAISADWLKPRCHKPAAVQRHRHQQALRRRCSPTSGAMYRAIVFASATLRPYLSRSASRATYRHRRPRRGSGRCAAAWPGRRRSARHRSLPAAVPQVTQPPTPRNSICVQQSAQKLCTSSTIVPQPAQRGGSAKSSTQRASRGSRDRLSIIAACRPAARAAQAPRGQADCSTCDLRALRRDRAFRSGPRAVPARARVRRLPRAARD